MSSRSFLLVLLVLTCLQSFTTASNENEPDRCCFSYQPHRIPVKLITAYEVIDHRCIKPGVVFTLKSGKQVCADPKVEWVKNIMKIVGQHLFTPEI